MGKRRKARENAIQILFQLEFDDSLPGQVIDGYWQSRKAPKEIVEYGTWLVEGIIHHKDEIDRIVQSVSEHWRISRMAVVDRNILRLAVFEFLYEKDLDKAIVINEAIEIAKKYSSDQASMFINGVLDAIKDKLFKPEDNKKDESNGSSQ